MTRKRKQTEDMFLFLYILLSVVRFSSLFEKTVWIFKLIIDCILLLKMALNFYILCIFTFVPALLGCFPYIPHQRKLGWPLKVKVKKKGKSFYVFSIFYAVSLFHFIYLLLLSMCDVDMCIPYPLSLTFRKFFIQNKKKM